MCNVSNYGCVVAIKRLDKYISFPTGNIEEKTVWRSVFLCIALHIECRFNKNALLQSYFLAVCRLGVEECIFDKV